MPPILNRHKILQQEIERRAHDIEGEGDGIYMVLIRMDSILEAVEAAKRRIKRKPK